MRDPPAQGQSVGWYPSRVIPLVPLTCHPRGSSELPRDPDGLGVVIITRSTDLHAAVARSAPGVRGTAHSEVVRAFFQGAVGTRVIPSCAESSTCRSPVVARAMAENEDLASAIADMHPVGRIGQPREIADVVVFLCSKGASFMTGSQIVVDGGALCHG